MRSFACSADKGNRRTRCATQAASVGQASGEDGRAVRWAGGRPALGRLDSTHLDSSLPLVDVLVRPSPSSRLISRAPSSPLSPSVLLSTLFAPPSRFPPLLLVRARPNPSPPLPFFSPRAPPPRPLPSLLLRPPGFSLQLAAMASGIPVRTTSSVDGLELGGSSDGLALPLFPCRPPARPGPAQASPLALVCLACAAASNPCPRLARPFSARELLTYFPPPSCASPPPPLLPLPLRFPSPYISSHIRSHRPDE